HSGVLGYSGGEYLPAPPSALGNPHSTKKAFGIACLQKLWWMRSTGCGCLASRRLQRFSMSIRTIRGQSLSMRRFYGEVPRLLLGATTKPSHRWSKWVAYWPY
ncbi:hypothetical protein H4R22_003368, partial [Coemansia sp. RSA 1290]